MKNLTKNYIDTGLTNEQVEERINDKKVNYDTSTPTKSIKKILAENIFTLFNFTNIILGIAVLLVGSYKNLLFLIIISLNTTISIVQEIKSKKAIDKLAVLAQVKVNSIRDGENKEIGINEIVLDDLLLLNSGDQIVTDCEILDGSVEVNEAFITGESDSIYKSKGDTLLSGSFVVSGNCKAKVINVAEDNFASKISSGAKKLKSVNSEIMRSLNKIVKVVSVAIVPIGILLFLHQYNLDNNSIKYAVVNTVAAIIGMIPEGLILLTSTVLAVSVIRLSKRRVLVQELYCIEALARVDTLCLDKTGTITEGKMKVHDIIEISCNRHALEKILLELSFASEDENSTIDAIKEKFYGTGEWEPKTKVSFSSQKKWSGISFKEKGSFVIGAPEFVLKEKYAKYQKRIEEFSKDYRVMVLAHSDDDFKERELPDNLEVLGLILISDAIRKDAAETLKFFKEQGVDIKIISGDSPITVAQVAEKVGLDNSDKYIDMRTVETEEKIAEIVDDYVIFGRVTPIQKKEIIKALKEKGHTVAMTGDGVNDVLALKESDCSIAIASGSDATRNISELVLLDSEFSSMPKIVEEGRRTINNIERSATLFLSKTIYSTILALFFLVASMPYPFMPIQLTLISVVTIGIPSFVLALEPNKERAKKHFLKNVISKALGTAITDVICIIITVIVCAKYNIAPSVYSSMCVIVTGFIGVLLLSSMCKPLDIFKMDKNKDSERNYSSQIIRTILFVLMLGALIVEITVFKDLFSIVLTKEVLPLLFVICTIAVLLFFCLNWINKKVFGVDKIFEISSLLTKRINNITRS